MVRSIPIYEAECYTNRNYRTGALEHYEAYIVPSRYPGDIHATVRHYLDCEHYMKVHRCPICTRIQNEDYPAYGNHYRDCAMLELVQPHATRLEVQA